MRKMKKIASLMMALVMVMAMSVTAFASTVDTDDTENQQYTITVSNSVTNSTYSAYKVFDATYSGDAVAYTISSTDAWYSLVSGTAKVTVTTTSEDGEETTTELGSPFILTTTTTTNVYNVSLAGDATDTSVAAWFNAIKANNQIPGSADATGTGNGGALTLDVTESGAGYYYITTSTGSLVTVNTAAPSVNVVDKNQTPGGDLEKTADDTSVQIGGSVTYTITSNVPAYDGETQIENYTFTDTLSDGLVAPEASAVTVKILDSTNKVYAYLTSETEVTAAEGETPAVYAVSVSNNVITVTYNPTTLAKATEVEEGDTLSDATSYPSDATIIITYSAVVDNDAAYANGNTVNQTWTGNSTGTTDTYTVYTYGFKLVKKAESADATEVLNGAEFQLTDKSIENASPIGFTVSTKEGVTYYTVSTDSTAETYTTTITAGSVVILGLDADVTYVLTETKAPDGYNKLTTTTEVKVGQSTTVGEETTYSYNTETGINTNDTVIVNNAGSSLPSTGGIGTTIFYVVGTVLVLGAAVVLITRRRMSSEA